MATKAPPVIVHFNPVQPESVEVIAKSIEEIAKGMRTLNNSRLTRQAVVALIANRSKLGKGTIEIVLNNLDQLEKNWLKPKK